MPGSVTAAPLAFARRMMKPGLHIWSWAARLSHASISATKDGPLRRHSGGDADGQRRGRQRGSVRSADAARRENAERGRLRATPAWRCRWRRVATDHAAGLSRRRRRCRRSTVGTRAQQLQRPGANPLVADRQPPVPRSYRWEDVRRGPCLGAAHRRYRHAALRNARRRSATGQRCRRPPGAATDVAPRPAPTQHVEYSRRYG